MTPDAREALRHLTTALEKHLEAVATRRSADDAAVDDAYDQVAESFERYEEALDAEFAESLPLVVDDSDDFDDAGDDAGDGEDDAGDADLDGDELDDEDEDVDDDFDEFDLDDEDDD